ncbi:uncharacterized protein LOC105829513 isoform X2 [Monomorium pharaonis]|uniref:uncharacterized protein LOC105829513 isoform X2 n=1 Tax=Monomorium pharaonis TaxID=307658 RepID=UPI00063F334B|nr:uncharacterized protein LOC105829513 isoform X2 [Monomorium pharaonis]
MTESSVQPRMKSRNGARLFKNPPQPHMCIQDFIQGTTAPCYVNVLSWDKIGMPCRSTQPIPLYGGMRVPPPRTKTEAIVFAVMANPEVLRMSGKNAQDMQRMGFIDLLLDFIEAMNEGIIFNRNYTILKDRDITGELKEVWNAVLAIRDNEQRPPPQQETWIDVQPAMSQYPQYPEQHQRQEYIPQPPQYHSNVAYGRTINNENMHYENYGHHPQSLAISKNEPVLLSRHNVFTFNKSFCNYSERGRDGQVVQNIIAVQPHQFSQPRQTWPQYMNTKYMHPNSNLPYGPAMNTAPAINNPSNSMKPFQPYVTYQQQQQQQQQQLISPPPPPPPPLPPLHWDVDTMHIDMRKIESVTTKLQPQQSQIYFKSQYAWGEKPGSFNVQNNTHRTSRPHMGVAQKNNSTKRQANSPTHTSCISCQNKDDQSSAKPKSPVKVLQRETPTERQDLTNHAEGNKTLTEKLEEPKAISVIDLDEDLKKSDEFVVEHAHPKEKEDVCNPELVRTVNKKSCEKKNSVKPVSCKRSLTETHETEAPPAMQQFIHHKNVHNKFVRDNARMRRMPTTKGDKHNSAESPRRSQPTMNSIIKSVFKINPNASGEESSGKKKANASQARSVNGKAVCENEEQGYTILKKEAQEEMVSEIAQLSIQDCKDATEVAPVLS